MRLIIHWEVATVKECLHARKGLQQIQVELKNGRLAKAIHYTDVMPPVTEGDQVLLNTTAVDLSLGTGGFHFVHSILSTNGRGANLQPNNPCSPDQSCNVSHHPLSSHHVNTTNQLNYHQGHLMKLRYTSLQRAVLAAEEKDSPYHELFTDEQKNLQRMPVLIGELHSMLPIAMCWLKYVQSELGQHSKQLKVVYIMSDGGAIPLSFSHHVAILNELGWLDGTVTYGHAYGGELETLNKYTALIVAKHVLQADIAIVLMGPGIAGTGTVFGHTGIEVGEIVNAVSILDGIPIVIPRISFADDRERHFGLSHHTIHSLKSIALKSSLLPLPNGLNEHQKNRIRQQIEQHDLHRKHTVIWGPSIDHTRMIHSLRFYPQEIKTMGKGLSADFEYFLGVCVAAQTAFDVYMGATLV